MTVPRRAADFRIAAESADPDGAPPVESGRTRVDAESWLACCRWCRHLHRPGELLAVLGEPTPEMLEIRALLIEHGCVPCRRTWERRLGRVPETLPAQISCLGPALVEHLQPWANCGRAVAIDSTVLHARGGVWHVKHRAADA